MDLVRHLKLSDLQGFATPGVTAQAGLMPTQPTFFARLEATRHEAADDREVMRGDVDVEIQAGNGTTNHRARLEQRDLGLRRGYRRIGIDHVSQAR